MSDLRSTVDVKSDVGVAGKLYEVARSSDLYLEIEKVVGEKILEQFIADMSHEIGARKTFLLFG